jgi:hypothetical protein
MNPLLKIIAKAITKDEPINAYLSILERGWVCELNARLFPRRDWFVAPKGIAYDENERHELGGTFWM